MIASSGERTAERVAATKRPAPGGLEFLRRVRLSERSLDVLLTVGLFAVALAVRLPDLMLIPSFTDETAGVLVSLRVMRGEALPLVNVNPYYGSLFNYLLAGVFLIFGPSAENARLLTTVVGALTVPLTYFFGRVVEDRRTGLLAAVMMLTSAGLIYGGHIAWENELTPFFATATFLLFTLALRRGSGALLVATGLSLGLTLQTHPGVIVLAVGLAVCFAWAGLRPRDADARRSLGSWLRSPWPYLALLAAVIGVGNVIAYNLLRSGTGFTVAQSRAYAWESSPTPVTYLVNLVKLGIVTTEMTASTFQYRSVLAQGLLLPVNLLYLAVLALGVRHAVKRRRLLLVLLLATSAVILPYFNRSYGYPIQARYISYLYPVLYLLSASVLLALVRAVPRADRLRMRALWLLIAFLVVWPLLSLAIDYHIARSSGNTNEPILAVRQAVRAQYRAGAISGVIVESGLERQKLAGGGDVRRALIFLFALDRTPARHAHPTSEGVRAELRKDPARPPVLILTPETHRTLSAELQLSRLEGQADGRWLGLAPYGAYVVTEADR